MNAGESRSFRVPMPIRLIFNTFFGRRVLASYFSSARCFRDTNMSPIAIALWYVLLSISLVKCSSSGRSIALKPSKEPLSFIPQSDLRITNIALGDELVDASGRTSVKLTYQTPIKLGDDDDDDEESAEPISTTVLGSLTQARSCEILDLTCILAQHFYFCNSDRAGNCRPCAGRGRGVSLPNRWQEVRTH